MHAKSHHFSLLPSNLLLSHLLLTAPHLLLTQWLVKLTRPFTSLAMPSPMRPRPPPHFFLLQRGERYPDGFFLLQCDILVASSSSNAAIEKMANKTTPTLSDYWKKSMVTEADALPIMPSAGWVADWSLSSLKWMSP
jgi:hypothetical protein